MLHRLIDLITSLKLTIVCLAAAMALIFAGTLAQVHLGIHEAQQRYFQSMFVWWPPEGRGFKIPCSRALRSDSTSRQIGGFAMKRWCRFWIRHARRESRT